MNKTTQVSIWLNWFVAKASLNWATKKGKWFFEAILFYIFTNLIWFEALNHIDAIYIHFHWFSSFLVCPNKASSILYMYTLYTNVWGYLVSKNCMILASYWNYFNLDKDCFLSTSFLLTKNKNCVSSVWFFFKLFQNFSKSKWKK